MNNSQNAKDPLGKLFETEEIILDKLVARFKIGYPSTNYSELKESMELSSIKYLDEALQHLRDHSIIYTADGVNYTISGPGISEFERRKNAGMLF